MGTELVMYGAELVMGCCMLVNTIGLVIVLPCPWPRVTAA